MLRTLSLLLVMALMLAACGEEEETGGGAGNSNSSTSGSCTMKDNTCFYVSDPATYDLKVECQVVGHTWAASSCPSSGFERKCTQKTKVSTENGPEQDVTYVYLFPAGNQIVCLGTEEKL